MHTPATPRIGLVLGAGGVVGHAYHAGVLAGIADATGWDARDADLIIGTSAGSVVGALLRAGLAADDIAARSTETAITSEGQVIVDLYDDAQRHLPPIPPREKRKKGAKMAAPRALMRGALPPWNARAGTLAAAALPVGEVPTELVSTGLRALFDSWPEAPLWINAVNLHTSQRVTFGRNGNTHVDVATAVGASCAVPSFFAPVAIDGEFYIDGGTHSLTNADLAVEAGLDLVVVSSPMSVAGRNVRVSPDEPFRRLARLALAREVARIRKAGTPVLTFQPTRAELDAMGLDAMDPDRRAAATTAARSSARRRLIRADARDRVALLAKSAG